MIKHSASYSVLPTSCGAQLIACFSFKVKYIFYLFVFFSFLIIINKKAEAYASALFENKYFCPIGH